MRRIRETLRLHLQAGLSYREIARALKLSKSVAGKYVSLARAAGVGRRLAVDFHGRCDAVTTLFHACHAGIGHVIRMPALRNACEASSAISASSAGRIRGSNVYNHGISGTCIAFDSRHIRRTDGPVGAALGIAHQTTKSSQPASIYSKYESMPATKFRNGLDAPAVLVPK